MSIDRTRSELSFAVAELAPYFRRAAGFSAIANLLQLMPIWYMLAVYDRVVNSRSHMTLAMVTFLVVGALVVMEVLEWVRSDQMHVAGMALDHRLSERTLTAVFEANFRYQDLGSSQGMGDLRTIRDFLTSPAFFSLMDVPIALIFLIAIYVISPVLCGVAALSALIQVSIGWLNERSTHPAMKRAGQYAVAAQQYETASLRNAQVIESMGMLPNIFRTWVKLQHGFLRYQASASVSAGGYQALSRLTQTTVGSALLGLSCWLLLRNELNGGGAVLMAAGILGGKILLPLVQLVTQWRSVIATWESWWRLNTLLNDIAPKSHSMPLPPPKGALHLDDVYAAVPNGNVAILKGITFSLSPGEVLAVVGPSASGKSTLARLLVGVWPASGGSVRLDGVDIYGWNKTELGPHVGYLAQTVELFDGTIAENIARLGDVDLGKVQNAAKAVGLHSLIEALPKGYDSPIGSEGAFLSGGVRQRVGLARAIYDDPVFVVLDEPNSSLDAAGDAALANTIAALKTRGTSFVVMTHRTSVLAVADKLLLLESGRVRIFGPIGQVLAAIQGNKAADLPAAAPLSIKGS